MIKAPYNFVPLASKVVFPDWASQISIDRPFEDGISGTINVKYTAQTPVFIGNGKGDGKSPIPNYKTANGKYAIPGSSLRGMLRNVIEIASFGKFNRVSDAALSVRDLTKAAKDLYRSHFTNKSINGGWLIFENNIWVVYPVTYYRVEDSDVERCYNLNKGCLKAREEFKDRVKRLKNNVKVYFSAEEKVSGLKLVDYPSSKMGFVVLTGNPGGNKHLDFVFEPNGVKKIEIPYETLLQFKQINTPKSADQKRGLDLTKRLNDCKKIGYPGIPVFYLPNAEGNPDSLGLSMMYRLPYENTLHDAIKHSSENNFSDKLDFAECMFGKIKDAKKKEKTEMNFSLRGRVQFEDATTNSVSFSEMVETILSNPKPTYYPNYIQQDSKNTSYQTLMNPNVQLRGWKRYPVKNELNPMPKGEDQDNVCSHFSPLQKGTVFEGRIHFHNLKKEELGALLWAITWGGDKNLSHAVGMGKPYGFGQLKAEIDSLSYLENESKGNEYKLASDEERMNWERFFETYMDSKVVGWAKTSQLKELLAMANPENAERKGWDLQHLSLKDEDKKNQFIEAKKSYSFLAPYSSDNQEMQLTYQNNNWRGANNNPNYGGRYNVGQNNRVYANSPQKLAHSEDGITNGSIQICVLLEEKTKKGGWRAMVKDVPNISGPIVNTAEVPADKNAGDEIELKIAAVNKVEGMTNFRYEKQ